MVVVVEGYVAAGLVQHGEQGAHAAQPREVHDVLHLGGVLQGLDHHPGGGEVGLQGVRCVPLDLVGGEGARKGTGSQYAFHSLRHPTAQWFL